METENDLTPSEKVLAWIFSIAILWFLVAGASVFTLMALRMIQMLGTS